MLFTYKGKRCTLIWDGQDSGITEETYKITCPFCKSIERYSAKDIGGLDTFNDDLIDYLLKKKIILKGNLGFEVKRGVPAYIIRHRCENCENNLWIIVGLKEIQPQRYNIYFKSVVYAMSPE